MDLVIVLSLACTLTTTAVAILDIQRCYQCKGIVNPERCTDIVTCVGSSYQCYVEEEADDQRRIMYNLGCEENWICNSGVAVGRRQNEVERQRAVTSCFKCCHGNLCNAVGCADLCQVNPCQHGARCTSDRSGRSHNCTCMPGYTGVHCETDINECQSNPCQHGGTCVDRVNGFSCTCLMGFTGVRCETELNDTVCLHCQGILYPHMCDNVVTCQPGQVCYTQAVFRTNATLTFNMGCQTPQQCQFYENLMGTPSTLGKRDREVSKCWDCCIEKRCNRESCLHAIAGHRSCKEYLAQGYNTSGVYTLYLTDGGIPFQAYCDMRTDGGGWVVIQRRMDGTVDFYKNWTDYQHGFGNLSTEFWLGNDLIHRLTSANLTTLRVDLAGWDGETVYATYSRFRVGNASTQYILDVYGYNGTAGDSLGSDYNQRFTTVDMDNSKAGQHNCATLAHGGWWYFYCGLVNLNGLYGNASSSGQVYVNWYDYKQDLASLKFTEMKLRER